MQIIFGTKKLTESARTVSVEKYEGKAVITVEGQKGAKKSRRILFNNTASTLLGLESGSVQQVVFAPIQDTRQVLIANLETIDEDARGEMVTYRTSKNKVSYGEDTTEKGKASTTSFMCKELFSFFGKEEDKDLEFELNEFPSESVEAYSLDLIEEIHESLLDVNSIELSEGAQEAVNDVVESLEDSEKEIVKELDKIEVIPTVDEVVNEFQDQEEDSFTIQRRTLV